MSGLNLEPPTTDGPAGRATDGFALDAATTARIKAVAREFAGSFAAIEGHDPEFDKLTRQIATIGREETRKLSEQALLNMSQSAGRERAIYAVDEQLARLRLVLDRLNPGNGNELIKPRKLFGLFSRASPLVSYFERYKQSEGEIETVLSIMAKSRDLLLQDSVAITHYRTAARKLLVGLAEAIQMCANLDERFERLSVQLDKSDPAKAAKIRSTALFEARQRHGDLLTQMAVSRQSEAILGIVLTNNHELVKGIDRASSTTIAALQTAIVAAQTLTNQKLVLNRIDGVKTAASSLMEGAGSTTAQGNRQIALDSAEAAEQVARLRSAFAELATSVDSLEQHQRTALTSL